MTALEQLEVGISPYSAGFPQRIPLFYPNVELMPYLREALGRKWLVTRSVRDDARHVLHVRELCHFWQCFAFGTPQGWCGRAKQRKAQGVDRKTRELVSKGGPFAEVWTRLWPDKGDGRLWLDSWESRPLELDSGEEGGQ